MFERYVTFRRYVAFSYVLIFKRERAHIHIFQDMYIVHVFQNTNQYLMAFFQRGLNAEHLGLTHKRALTVHATHL
jgi:hypothetical protein